MISNDYRWINGHIYIYTRLDQTMGKGCEMFWSLNVCSQTKQLERPYVQITSKMQSLFALNHRHLDTSLNVLRRMSHGSWERRKWTQPAAEIAAAGCQLNIAERLIGIRKELPVVEAHVGPDFSHVVGERCHEGSLIPPNKRPQTSPQPPNQLSMSTTTFSGPSQGSHCSKAPEFRWRNLFANSCHQLLAKHRPWQLWILVCFHVFSTCLM